MITKFSALYVGQIERDNAGLGGTPADERRYPNERLAEAFHTAATSPRSWTSTATPVCGRPSITSKEQLRWFAKDVMPAFTTGRR